MPALRTGRRLHAIARKNDYGSFTPNTAKPHGLWNESKLARKQEALQIPRVALVETDGERSVFVVQKGLARQRSVTTGLTDAGNIEITDGIGEGDQVVIVGQSGLKDGNKVRVVALATKSAGLRPAKG